MPLAYIGLGSNLGCRLANLGQALYLLDKLESTSVESISPVYETPPVGGPEQGPFLNACASLQSLLPPTVLLHKMLDTERSMGRIRQERWGPRIIDLDLLNYDNITMATPLLKLPHPRLAERDFVLLPLADIAPDLVIAGTSCTVRQILSGRKPAEGVKMHSPQGWHRKQRDR